MKKAAKAKIETKKKRSRKPKPTQRSSFVGSKRLRPKRPDKRQLRAIFRGLLTATPETRVNTLIAAVHWYDTALEWIKDDEKKNVKLQSIMKLKTLNMIESIRDISIETLDLSSREEHLKRIITKFEDLLKGILRTKSITSVYQKLSKMRSRLEKRAARLSAKYQMIIDMLQDSLSPQNSKGESVKLKVGDNIKVNDEEKPRHASVDFRTILYSRSHAQQMLFTFRQEGLLPVALTEINWLARVCAYKANDQDKGHLVDIQQDRKAIFDMMNNLIDYCRMNPKISKKLVRTRRKSRKRK